MFIFLGVFSLGKMFSPIDSWEGGEVMANTDIKFLEIYSDGNCHRKIPRNSQEYSQENSREFPTSE